MEHVDGIMEHVDGIMEHVGGIMEHVDESKVENSTICLFVTKAD
jgi:hypothetical protein